MKFENYCLSNAYRVQSYGLTNENILTICYGLLKN